ncbi:MAG: C-GCAxxG-C-C family (seleno)protein [Candidatus Latescibacterota bacterium]
MSEDSPQIVQRSGELFDSGYLCAESVLVAIAESSGISTDAKPGIAAGFCSGMARTNRMCGQ